MTPEEWKRLDDLFEEASALPPADWEGFAGSRCAGDDDLRLELLTLLRAQGEADELFGKPLAHVGSLVDGANGSTSDVMIGQRLGSYTIESILGRGGMGVVYRARQDSPQRIVALKVVNPGAIGGASFRRFQREAEALGRLQHAGVAQIFESGQARTPLGLQPFFAMELVEGKPLLDYVNEQRLSVRQRLDLFARICDAVQFAHVKGIIHRDLKPGNILVDGQGQPKILDFGIARLTDSNIRATTVHTSIGQLIGTIPYMSPEQAAGDPRELDTRSDVYALGVVLYELLSGRLPYDLKERAITEAVRVVTEQEPTRLSSISRTFRGDIETIAGKALEKDRTRRYQSAADFAADVRRFLADEAIVARPASATYQLRKFARRNKVLVGGIVCAMVLLIAGIVGTSIGLARAIRVEKQAKADAASARLEARTANETTTFVQNMLKAANPESGRRGDLTVRDLLMQSSIDLDGELAGEPEVCAAVHYTIGSAFVGMTDYPRATEHLERSLELRREIYGYRGWRVSNCVHKLATIEFYRGDRDAGLRAMREGLEMIKADPDALWEDVAIQHLDLSQILNTMGNYGDAEKIAKRAIEIATESGGARHSVTASATSALAGVLINQGKYGQAEPLLREAINIAQEKFGARSPRVASYQIDLGKVLMSLSREAEAEEMLQSALATRRSIYGAEHPKVAVALDQLAQLQLTAKKYALAEASAQESLDIRRKALGDDDADTVSSIIVLCRILMRQNKLDAAEPLARQALEIRRRLLGEENKLTAQSMESLGELLFRQKKYSQAKEILTRAVEVRRRVLGPRHVLVSNGLRTLGQMSAEEGKLEEAVGYYTEAASILDEAFDDDHSVLVGVRKRLGSILATLKRYDEAEAVYRSVLTGLTKLRGSAGAEVADCLESLAKVVLAKGDEKGSDELKARAKVARETAAPARPESAE